MTEQRTNFCTLYMLISLISGVFGIAVLYWFAENNKAEQIENKLSLKSNQLLNDSQIGGVVVNIDWRDATLTGTAVSKERSTEIEKIVAALPGIRSVDNQLQINLSELIIEAQKAEIVTEPVSEPEPQTELNTQVEVLDLSGSNEIMHQEKLVLDDVANISTDHAEFKASVEGYNNGVRDDDLNFELNNPSM